MSAALFNRMTNAERSGRAEEPPKSPWVIHPWILAVVPVVSLFAANVHETLPRDLTAPVLIALGAVTGVWLILRLALRDAQRASLIAVLAVAVFFTIDQLDETYNALLNRFWVLRLEPYEPWPYVLPALELALFAGLVWWVFARLKRPNRLTSFLNLFAVIALIMPATEAWWALAHRGPTRGRQAPVLATNLAPERRPDIYYIILDAYARSDVMKELFGFDNTPFLRHLEDQGFYVARRSTANYCQTPLCLSSSLNGTYLDELVEGLENDQTELSGLIGDSAVFRTLRPLGYKFVTFSTGFDPTEHPQLDVYLSPSKRYTGFHRLLIDRTPLHYALQDPKERDSYTAARERILYLLDKVPQIARDRSPTFTFAHILSPHPPFIFGENGEDVGQRQTNYYLNDGQKFRDETVGSVADYARSYRAQASFITKRVEQMIDQILKNSPEPPIIIVHSDHGSGLRLEMSSAERSDMHERMSIFNAYYFPNRRYEGLNDRISPVNSFRVMLNTVFGAKIPLLPDRSYFSTWNNPYRFIDVTAQVRSPDGPEPDCDERSWDD